MNFGIEAGKMTLDLAVELGVRGVPIGADALVKDGPRQTLAPLRERGLVPCQIGAFGYNPLSPDLDKRAAQREVVRAALELAADVDCRYVVISGGNHHRSTFGAVDPRNFRPAALDEVARQLEPLVRHAERCSALLCIEPYLKTAVHSADAFCALHARLPSPALKANIDVTSLYDFADLLDPSSKVAQTCDLLAPHAGLLHVKEVALADGFHLHAGLVPLGHGPTDWADVLSRVVPHLADDSWLLYEHVASPEEARAGVRLLRESATRVGATLV